MSPIRKLRTTVQCFEEALRRDRTYAPAHVGIADSYIVEGGRYLDVPPKIAYARARSAALQLDDNLAEAHTSLAAVMTDFDCAAHGTGTGPHVLSRARDTETPGDLGRPRAFARSCTPPVTRAAPTATRRTR